VELNGLRDLVDTLPLVSLQNILQGTTKILRNELRGNDIIGRWNDISFVILLPNTPGVAAKSIFERIVQALAQPIELNVLGETVQLDCHIGAAESNNHISGPELLAKASNALDLARRSIKNPISITSASV
jgi:diguanylate cyclase (GGDEF)-like protein